MQPNEFYRIPLSGIVNVPSDGDIEPIAITAAKRFGRTMNPVIVIRRGMHAETFETLYEIVYNNSMAEVAKLAGLEYVDAFLVDVKDALTAKDLFA